MSTTPLHNLQELVSRMAGGSEEAFAALYDRYWRTVYSYVEAIVKSAAAAEEMSADIFLALWQSRERLHSIENFEAYLRTVAKNKALDFLKATARRKQREYIYRTELIIGSPPAPDERLLAGDVWKWYQDCLARLSPQRLQVFKMYREEGLSYEEIAKALHISPATAKKTVFDALAVIKKFLQEHYDRLVVLILPAASLSIL